MGTDFMQFPAQVHGNTFRKQVESHCSILFFECIGLCPLTNYLECLIKFY